MIPRAFIVYFALQSWQATAIVPSVYAEEPLRLTDQINVPVYQRSQQISAQQQLDSTWGDVSYAVETMQKYYFSLNVGTWPQAIDWTRAVMGTHINTIMRSLSRALGYESSDYSRHKENDINKYFSQAITYFFGEDALAVRNQAYDDMLWIVLGWLENIRFMDLHSERHRGMGGNYSWYGSQFSEGFAHRARIFYQLSSKGWDTKDCDGGMIWNPRLEPYKNAITNQLYITASISMWLYFPGDNNESPFKRYSVPGHHPMFRVYAVKAYEWLKRSGMKNDQGLYIDGFHIRGGRCTVRNEMVYTYNQGVILSGLRGLWEATGDISYLVDGHRLIRNTIRATGYSIPMEHDKPPLRDNFDWAGLGRNGILEDACDHDASCSQDGQTFKGIYFLHFTAFCEALPTTPSLPDQSHTAPPLLLERHARACRSYTPWVTRNAVAAMRTRTADGKYGMWWNAGDSDAGRRRGIKSPLPNGAEDYRNRGIGNASLWGEGWAPGGVRDRSRIDDVLAELDAAVASFSEREVVLTGRDVNDRNRGRTVETQSGGVAVTRAMWEFIFQHGFAENEGDAAYEEW
jgi:Glycosyl hydrolase family 76